jgi:hypothetical protein
LGLPKNRGNPPLVLDSKYRNDHAVRYLTEIAIRHFKILSKSLTPELTAIVEPLYRKIFVETPGRILSPNTREGNELKNEMFQYLQTQVWNPLLLPYSRAMLTQKLFSMYRGTESGPQVTTLSYPTCILSTGNIHGVWTVRAKT